MFDLSSSSSSFDAVYTFHSYLFCVKKVPPIHNRNNVPHTTITTSAAGGGDSSITGPRRSGLVEDAAGSTSKSTHKKGAVRDPHQDDTHNNNNNNNYQANNYQANNNSNINRSVQSGSVSMPMSMPMSMSMESGFEAMRTGVGTSNTGVTPTYPSYSSFLGGQYPHLHVVPMTSSSPSGGSTQQSSAGDPAITYTSSSINYASSINPNFNYTSSINPLYGNPPQISLINPSIVYPSAIHSSSSYSSTINPSSSLVYPSISQSSHTNHQASNIIIDKSSSQNINNNNNNSLNNKSSTSFHTSQSAISSSDTIPVPAWSDATPGAYALTFINPLTSSFNNPLASTDDHHSVSQSCTNTVVADNNSPVIDPSINQCSDVYRTVFLQRIKWRVDSEAMYGGLKKLLFGQAQTLRVKSKSLLQKVFTSYAKHYQLLNALDAKQLNFYHSDRLVTDYNITVEQFGLQSEGTIEVVFINGNKDDPTVDDTAAVERDVDSIYIDWDINKAITTVSGGSSSGGHYSSQYADAIRCGRYTVEQIEVGPSVVRSTNAVDSMDELDYFHASSAKSTGDTSTKQDAGIDDVSFADAEVVYADGGRDAKTVASESCSAIAVPIRDDLCETENVSIKMNDLESKNAHVTMDPIPLQPCSSVVDNDTAQNSSPSVEMTDDGAGLSSQRTIRRANDIDSNDIDATDISICIETDDPAAAITSPCVAQDGSYKDN